MITNYKEALDSKPNSPCQHLRICVVNSIENIHNDVKGVKGLVLVLLKPCPTPQRTPW